MLPSNQRQVTDDGNISTPITSCLQQPLVGSRQCQCLCSHHISTSTISGRQQTISMSLLLPISSPTTSDMQQTISMTLLPSHLFIQQSLVGIRQFRCLCSSIFPLEQSLVGSRGCQYLCFHHILSSIPSGRQQKMSVSLLLHILSSTIIGRQQMILMSLLPSHMVFNVHWQAADTFDVSSPPHLVFDIHWQALDGINVSAHPRVNHVSSSTTSDRQQIMSMTISLLLHISS